MTVQRAVETAKPASHAFRRSALRPFEVPIIPRIPTSVPKPRPIRAQSQLRRSRT